MRIYLPRNLFPQIHEDPAVNPTSRRKVVLPRITRQIMEGQGYVFGNKIRVPGGYAFEATDPNGRALKIGLKTAVNRWLNTATTLVEMVDTVIVTTFKWNEEDEKPEALELIEVASADLLGMVKKVRSAARKEGRDPNGHYYMPLDEELIEGDSVWCAAGAVMSVGRRIFRSEPVIWVADEWGRTEATNAGTLAVTPSVEASARPVDVAAIVAETKAVLAAQLGVPTSNIDLSIRF
ncbi:MAG: hypothetical protein KF780_05475 [Sphingomonas sp.]|nr:hypothetical protein [Sphingomonas sp.]